MMWMSAKTADDEAWINHTVLVQKQIAMLFESAVEAETDLSEYLLSEDARYDREYTRNEAVTIRRQAELSRLIRDNPAQTARLVALVASIQKDFSDLERAAKAGRSRRTKESDESYRSINQLRGQADRMSAVEQTLLNSRSATSRQDRIIEMGIILGALMIYAILGAVAWIEESRIARTKDEFADTLARLAHHDALTGLPNRTLFGLRLREAIVRSQRSGKSLALWCIDLDHFKEVNDTYGHAVGDALLKQVTDRITLQIRGTDTVARLGGDEFSVIQSDVKLSNDIAILAERLIASLMSPFEIDGRVVKIGASIGISAWPRDATDPEDLIRHADLALYSAKAAGRGRFRFFDADMEVQARERRVIVRDLDMALERDEFELFYQPIVRAANGDVVGMEALLRWRHPDRGLLLPGDFLPAAEAHGLMIPIGAWVLAHACADAAGWPESLRVAVNISPHELASPSIVDRMEGILKQSGLDPARLELEITETAIFDLDDSRRQILRSIKTLGVSIALDDFGTGYSSLSHLQLFPFDKLKIDRSFVVDLVERHYNGPIVSGIIQICHGLDIETVAEGVETEEQVRILSESGCSQLQGYYFSRPIPASQIPVLLHRLRNRRNKALASGARSNPRPAVGYLRSVPTSAI